MDILVLLNCKLLNFNFQIWTSRLSGSQMKVDHLQHPFSPELNIGGGDCAIRMQKRVPVDVRT